MTQRPPRGGKLRFSKEQDCDLTGVWEAMTASTSTSGGTSMSVRLTHAHLNVMSTASQLKTNYSDMVPFRINGRLSLHHHTPPPPFS